MSVYFIIVMCIRFLSDKSLCFRFYPFVYILVLGKKAEVSLAEESNSWVRKGESKKDFCG